MLRDYQDALRAHLARPGEPTLQRAYALGRRALEEGLGVVDLGALYHRAISAVLPSGGAPAQCASTMKALESFFVESLAPYEMTHRGYRESETALRHLNELLEDDARKIAHALHDEAGQLLVTVHLALAELSQTLPPGHEAQLENIRSTLDEVENQLRRLSHELRPPVLDNLGLLAALRALAEGYSQRANFEIVILGPAEGRFSPVIEIALYRIVLEALNNVRKHARASRVEIQFQRTAASVLKCSIRDDGVGFDVRRVMSNSRKGFGLRGIQERLRALDATIEIKSNPGSGTALLIEVPLGN